MAHHVDATLLQIPLNRTSPWGMPESALVNPDECSALDLALDMSSLTPVGAGAAGPDRCSRLQRGTGARAAAPN
jgi:hypothetical protein